MVSNREIDKEFFETNKAMQTNQELDKLEKYFLNDIEQKQIEAESNRLSGYTDDGTLATMGIETVWEDENKMYEGNQWETTIAYRSWKEKRKRPNCINNLIFNAIQSLQGNITASIPTLDVQPVDDEEQEQIKPEQQQEQIQKMLQQIGQQGQQPPEQMPPEQMQGQPQPQQQVQQTSRESENAKTKPLNHEYTKKDIADKLTCMLQFNMKRNKFSTKWKNIVLEYLKHGPAIIMIMWNDDWIGGRGPKKWVGDVEIVHVRKEDFFPDPAIIDLDYRMQECSFINRKFRKKLSYIKKRWKENGTHVNEEDNGRDTYQNEGSEHGQTWLVEHWHRGKPKFIPEERKKELLELAKKYKKIDEFKAKDYEDMAKGEIEGVHLAYTSNGVFLEYIPYIFEHGMYPFVFRTRYRDVNNQLGWGEIRQIINPQLMYNKADETEMDAFNRQGMGQEFYQKGTINPRQLEKITSRSGIGGEMFEVDQVNGIVPRQGVVGNPALTNFKMNKQNMIDKVSSVSPVMQGKAEYSNMPASAISMLGSRADVRTKSCIEILEDLLNDVGMLVIELFSQFYEDDRYYTIKGDQGTKAGKFNREMMVFTYTREGKPETFVPEFEISVRIMDEKPTDRNTITQQAFALQDRQIYQPKHVLYALEEGKLPSKETVMQDMKEMLQQQQDMMAQKSQAETQKLQLEMQKLQIEIAEIQSKMQLDAAKLELEKHKVVIDGQDKQSAHGLAVQGHGLAVQNQMSQMQQNQSQQPQEQQPQEQPQQMQEQPQEQQMQQMQETQEQPQMQEQQVQEQQIKVNDNFMTMLQQKYPEFVDLLNKLPEDAKNKILQQASQLSEAELEQSIPELVEIIHRILQSEGGDEDAEEGQKENNE